ncbi:MAG: hypothetical protein ACYC6N_07520 [Pirellulaceae bacterium]
MNRRVVFVSTFAAVVMMSMMAYGQQRQGGQRDRMRMGAINSAMLLRAEAVQKELNITEEQKAKLEEMRTEGRGQGGAGQRNFQDMTEEERQKMREEMVARTAEQEKKIAEILDAQQVARLKQIRLQASGAMGLMNEDVAKELNITEEQRNKMRDAMRDLRESAQADGGPGGFAEMREKMNAKVMEILTDEQKAQYKEMQGEPFDVAQLRMGGPGGGRRGGGN